MRKQKEKLDQEIINLTRSFIENDPKGKLLNFLASENERSRRHEAEMMPTMLQINNSVRYNQAHFIQIFRNAYYQDRESSLTEITEIRMLPNLNHQYHSRINKRSVAQELVKLSMLILRTQHLLLMTTPGLHINHLTSSY